VLNLRKKAVQMAIGVAGAAAPVASDMKCSLNPLNREVGMPMVKNNYGWASLAGVNATILAKMGYTGPSDIFEGDTGFWRMYGSDRCDFDKFRHGLGRTYHILKVGFKPYACVRYTHPALDATLKIIKDNKLVPGDIERITVSTFSDITILPWNDQKPKTVQSALFSVPYCIASAITGSTGLEWFTEASLRSPKILRVAKKVELVGDPEADKVKVEWGKGYVAKVQICSKKGFFQDAVDYPKGEPENPMTDEELRAKFKQLAKKVIAREKAEAVLQMIENLESIQDVVEIARNLKARNA
jgi:2-methylcitrate dehydratase PrpD